MGLPSVVDIRGMILAHRFRFSNEKELQDGIWTVLSGLPDASREMPLNSRDRIDFLVGGVGIEVKVEGSLAEVARQMVRYAECDAVTSLVLVTTRQRHARMPKELNGKDVSVIFLWGIL